MKKFAISIIAGVAMLTGIACGGGSSWSDADKAQLEQGKTLAITLGVMTEDQAECYGDWLQDHYDSMAKAIADESDAEAQYALNKACKLNAEVTTPKKVVTTTTSAGPSCYEAKAELKEFVDNTDNFYGDWRTEMDRLMRAEQKICN